MSDEGRADWRFRSQGLANASLGAVVVKTLDAITWHDLRAREFVLEAIGRSRDSVWICVFACIWGGMVTGCRGSQGWEMCMGDAYGWSR